MPQTQPLQPTGNIQHTNSTQAQGILRPIRLQAGQAQTIDQQSIQIVIDATDHPDAVTAGIAFSTIGSLPDKQLFVAALLKHASDHSRPVHASAAYEAMEGALDLGPFCQVIERGVVSQDTDIALAALSPIRIYAFTHRTMAQFLEQSLILGMGHSDDSVANHAIMLAALSSNHQPFISAFQKCANNPALPKAAKLAAFQLQRSQNLSSSHHATSFSPQSTSVNVSTGSDTRIKNVRLDFNIQANGVGPTVGVHDAVLALGNMFDKSIVAGFAAAKAEVFYSPTGAPDDGRIIDVKFPASDKGHILGWLPRKIVPEFDLQKESDGVYTITLKERPFL